MQSGENGIFPPLSFRSSVWPPLEIGIWIALPLLGKRQREDYYWPAHIDVTDIATSGFVNCFVHADHTVTCWDTLRPNYDVRMQ